MSVQSFGTNILAAKVKSLEAQHDLILSNVTDNVQYGHTYTHHINGPNVANPNDYIFSVYENSATGNHSATLMSATTLSTSGTPPFNVTALSLDADLITFQGLVNIKNSAGSGQATLAIGAAPSIEVTGGLQDLTTNSVIILTQASPNTGGTDVAIPLYVEAGVSGNGKFTIYTTATTAVAVKVNYFVAKF